MLEFRRVVATTWNRGLWRTVVEFVVLPLMVAFIMVTSFLARSAPDAQGEAFLFFGTIYAFWCGLFGTCQAFNGEVNSGEWSYWMLGLHRGVVRHYIAHFVAGFFFAMLQVCISLLFLWSLWKIGAVIKPLGFFFVAPDDGNSFINQFGTIFSGGTAYNLQGLYAAMKNADHSVGRDHVLWFSMCSGFYLGAVTMAVASGVSIGLLVSAICPTPHVSQNAAVLLIVACCICSHTGTVGFGGDTRAEREFAPVDLIIRQKGRQYQDAKTYDGLDRGKRRQTQWKDGGAVEQISFALPQRYFFNMARILCLKLESSLGYDVEMRPWHNPERLVEHSSEAADFCKCPACIGLVKVAETNGEYIVSWGRKECNLQNHWIKGKNSSGHWEKDVLVKLEGEDVIALCGDPVKFRQALSEDVGGVGSLISFCRRMAAVEALALLFWCAIYAGITIVLLKMRRQFNELR